MSSPPTACPCHAKLRGDCMGTTCWGWSAWGTRSWIWCNSNGIIPLLRAPRGMLPALWNIRWKWLLLLVDGGHLFLAPSHQQWFHPRRRTSLHEQLSARELGLRGCNSIYYPCSTSKGQLGSVCRSRISSMQFTEGVPELTHLPWHQRERPVWARRWHFGWFQHSIVLELVYPRPPSSCRRDLVASPWAQGSQVRSQGE